MSKLGDLIREARRSKGWTQEKLAEEIGVNPGYIGQIETGVVKLPSAGKLESLEAALGVNRADMLRAAGLLGPEEKMNVLNELHRIVALPTDEAKRAALRQLPQDIQAVLELLARDALRLAFTHLFEE